MKLKKSSTLKKHLLHIAYKKVAKKDNNQVINKYFILHMVFHRILDFKAGLDFYLGPFFIFKGSGEYHTHLNDNCLKIVLEGKSFTGNSLSGPWSCRCLGCSETSAKSALFFEWI
ncbi:MAG TPA: hypothetical protein VFI29_22360 [Hanamia sp.]|nr:hypothetical protein [Hanamia sp.]